MIAGVPVVQYFPSGWIGGDRCPGWMETGVGVNPLPVSPTPIGDVPYGPLLGKMLKSMVCAPEHGFPPDIATHCPRPLWAGEEREARAGWGLQITTCVAETGLGITIESYAIEGGVQATRCERQLHRLRVSPGAGIRPDLADSVNIRRM